MPYPLLGAALICATVLLPLSSCQRFEVEELYAIRLDGDPGGSHWEAGVPLKLKAGGGHVHGKKNLLAAAEVDTDPIHAASASCHHGPPITDPVPLEVRAYYNNNSVFIEVLWEDRTPDHTPRTWKRTPYGWEVTDTDEDGLAILWSRYPGRFGCQEACHVDDWSVRAGTLVDSRAMYLVEEGAWEEAWVWKSAGGTRTPILDKSGFVTTAQGNPYRILNSATAQDPALVTEARRAGAFSGGDSPLWDESGQKLPSSAQSAPAYLWGEEEGERFLSVRAGRWRKGWRVVFSRSLEIAGRRQVFRPGEKYRFGVAIFDGTSTNHHLVRDTQVLELVIPDL